MHIIFIVVLTSFILSIITGYLLIPILKKLKADQSISKYLERAHKSKNHTPTIGGLIFILPTLVITFILYILKKIEINYTLIIVIFSFISFNFSSLVSISFIVILKFLVTVSNSVLSIIPLELFDLLPPVSEPPT